jgi:predicted metalloprotease
MRWTRSGRSANLEDRRGMRLGGGMGMGIGGTVVLLVLSLIFGKDLLSGAGGGAGAVPVQDAGPYVGTPDEEEQVDFLSAVLDDAQATWARIFSQSGRRYQDARLVVFRDATQSACGIGQSATGPFYCPGDQRVYLDVGFFQELASRFGAPGDFAQAYVLAHEIGHHVQHLLGVDQQVRAAQQRSPEDANELSVRLELQADCYAGVWGHETSGRVTLESGDAEEGLNAAAAIGDDRIQRMSGGMVSPESFTHGSSSQRVDWLRRGLQSGRVETCDTFQ